MKIESRASSYLSALYQLSTNLPISPFLLQFHPAAGSDVSPICGESVGNPRPEASPMPGVDGAHPTTPQPSAA